MRGRHMGSKSLVAAPLQAHRYHMDVGMITQFREIMNKTQILH